MGDRKFDLLVRSGHHARLVNRDRGIGTFCTMFCYTMRVEMDGK